MHKGSNPPSPIFFIFIQFSETIIINDRLAPPLGLAPRREILDQPLLVANKENI